MIHIRMDHRIIDVGGGVDYSIHHHLFKLINFDLYTFDTSINYNSKGQVENILCVLTNGEDYSITYLTGITNS